MPDPQCTLTLRVFVWKLTAKNSKTATIIMLVTDSKMITKNVAPGGMSLRPNYFLHLLRMRIWAEGSVNMAQAHRLRLALVQLAVGKDKATNLRRAVEKVREASQNGANIVVLPVELCWLFLCHVSSPLLASQECFNSPYGCEYFKEYAEPVPAEIGQPGTDAGESCRALSQVARECKIFLVGGVLVTFVVCRHKCNHSLFLCRINSREEWR